MTYPKIELHLHLEGAVSPELLLQIARRNHVRLPVDDVDGLRRLYAFRDFAHFIEAYTLAMQVLRAERDFREVVVAYAEQAKAHGAVYIEAIFGPSDSVRAGASWDEVYSGYCDGAQAAWEEHGVQIALTPDIARQYSIEDAEFVGRYAAKYRDRGVVGLGLGGLEVGHPPEPFAEVFATARDSGLASLPHAGEVVGPASIRGALTALNADRIRHGIRAVDDPTLVTDLADRQLVLDVCPISNLRTGAVRSLDAHPLPHLFRAGVPCSLSTDDPAMFDTDLGRVRERGRALGDLAAGVLRSGRARCGLRSGDPRAARTDRDSVRLERSRARWGPQQRPTTTLSRRQVGESAETSDYRCWRSRVFS